MLLVEELVFDEFAAVFDAEQFPGCAGAAVAYFDSGATKSIEEFGAGGLLAEPYAQRAEPFVKWGDGVIAHATDLPAAEIDDCKGFEDIVELAGGELDVQLLITRDASCVFEVADAVLIKDDPLDR